MQIGLDGVENNKHLGVDPDYPLSKGVTMCFSRSLVSIMVISSAILLIPATSFAASPIFGTNKDDVLNGTSQTEFILGFNGSDTIDGGTTNPDYIDGGDGFDFMQGRMGSFILGGTGDDIVSVRGITAFDQKPTNINCGSGEDFIFVDALGLLAPTGINQKNCEEEYEWQYGTKSWGSSYREAGPRPDSVLLRGTNGPDRLMGLGRMENMIGGPGNDLIFGNAKPDQIGGDLLLGGDGDDFIDTGNNKEGSYNNTVTYVRAGSGNDLVIARSRAFNIDCGAGYDIVYVNGADPKDGKMPPVTNNCEEIAYMG